MLKDYISTKEAAGIIGITMQHVCRLCREGLLDGIIIGNSYIISRQSAASYEIRKRGIKLGQKMPRKNK